MKIKKGRYYIYAKKPCVVGCRTYSEGELIQNASGKSYRSFATHSSALTHIKNHICDVGYGGFIGAERRWANKEASEKERGASPAQSHGKRSRYESNLQLLRSLSGCVRRTTAANRRNLLKWWNAQDFLRTNSERTRFASRLVLNAANLTQDRI